MLNSRETRRASSGRGIARLIARKLGPVFRKILFGALSTLIVVLLVAVGYLGRIVMEPTVAQDFRILPEIATVLGEDFVQPELATPEALRNGAIQGIFAALDDSHSAYIEPDDYLIQKNDLDGTFEGIGATVSLQDEWLIIVQPLPDSPAERAGLQPGDLILSVDGESARGWSVQKGVLRIRGLAGTEVSLGIRHLDGGEETLSIERASITQASVGVLPPGEALTDRDGDQVTDYGYIRIRAFTRSTPEEMQEALAAVLDGGAQGIILDLRGNPGGLLAETIQVVDMFLDGGDIVTQVARDGSEQHASATPGTLTDLPLVILQDRFSASGAELLAAAIKENGRGTVVGTRSFGKGTVNHVRELSNGGAVYVSIARWLTPDRNQIEGDGVEPNFEVTPTDADIEARNDVWMFRALEVLRDGPR